MPHCKLQPGSPHKKSRATTKKKMSIPSKPIPIPSSRGETADYPHSNDEMIARDAEIYDAATWRMFDRITSARLRAASNNNNNNVYYKVVDPSSVVLMTQDDHDNNAAATTTSSQQQLDATRRDRVFSLPLLPEPPSVHRPPLSFMMDEVFPMDSL